MLHLNFKKKKEPQHLGVNKVQSIFGWRRINSSVSVSVGVWVVAVIQKVVSQRESTLGCKARTLNACLNCPRWCRSPTLQKEPGLLLIFPFSPVPSWYDYLKEFCSWLCNKSPLRTFSLPLPPRVPPCQWRAALTGAGLQVALSEDGGDPGGIIKAVVIRTEGWGIQNGPSCCSVFSPEKQRTVINIVSANSFSDTGHSAPPPVGGIAKQHALLSECKQGAFRLDNEQCAGYFIGRSLLRHLSHTAWCNVVPQDFRGVSVTHKYKLKWICSFRDVSWWKESDSLTDSSQMSAATNMRHIFGDKGVLTWDRFRVLWLWPVRLPWAPSVLPCLVEPFSSGLRSSPAPSPPRPPVSSGLSLWEQAATADGVID